MRKIGCRIILPIFAEKYLPAKGNKETNKSDCKRYSETSSSTQPRDWLGLGEERSNGTERNEKRNISTVNMPEGNWKLNLE